MSTYKEYINEFGKIISSQQASQLDDYDEKFYENDRVKNITHYWDSEIQFITVHIYPDEDVSTVLSSLTEPDMEYSIAKDLEIINGYRAWKYFHYKNGVLNDEYNMVVFDLDERIVASRDFNANGTIQKNGYKKYYIGGNVLYDDNGEVDIGCAEGDYILFDFSGDNLKIEMVLAYGDDGIYDSVSEFLDVWQTLLPFMTPEKLTYLSNLEPLIPNVDLYS